MNRYKKVILTVLGAVTAIVLALGVKGLTNTDKYPEKKETEKKLTPIWFRLKPGAGTLAYGNTAHLTAATTASNYEAFGSSEPCDGEDDILCGIYAEPTGGNPNMPVISGSIATALNSYFASTPSKTPALISEVEQ